MLALDETVSGRMAAPGTAVLIASSAMRRSESMSIWQRKEIAAVREGTSTVAVALLQPGRASMAARMASSDSAYASE